MPPRIEGESPGSRSRVWREVSRWTGSPSSCRYRSWRSSEACSSGSTATCSVPVWRYPAERPASSSSSAMNDGYRAAESRLSATTAASPNSASPTGAIIPAAKFEEPDPGSGSTTATLRPARAARQATDRPITPPPMTAASTRFLRCSSSLRGGLRRADPIKAIAHAENGGDAERDLCEGLELLAEPADVDVDGLGVAIEAVSPDRRDDRLAGEHPAGVAEQQ